MEGMLRLQPEDYAVQHIRIPSSPIDNNTLAEIHHRRKKTPFHLGLRLFSKSGQFYLTLSPPGSRAKKLKQFPYLNVENR